MRMNRWTLIGFALVAFGAMGGFAISLLRPRRYGQPERYPGT
jgi:uncharacterized membrane protein YdjX (TVP38/TMEM64 family)